LTWKNAFHNIIVDDNVPQYIISAGDCCPLLKNVKLSTIFTVKNGERVEIGKSICPMWVSQNVLIGRYTDTSTYRQMHFAAFKRCRSRRVHHED